MKNFNGSVSISALRFPVLVETPDEGWAEFPVILTKEQLNAAGLVGESSKEVINRICEREGRKVLYIGKPERRTFEIDLSEMWD